MPNISYGLNDDYTPRDEGKLREELLKLREKENVQEATHIEDTQRLVTEIEMLKVVLYLVSIESGNSRVDSATFDTKS